MALADGTAVGHGLTAEPWTRPRGPARTCAARPGFVVWSQVEAGHGCPVSMTYAAVPALRARPDLAAAGCPASRAAHYDFGLRPVADKAGADSRAWA